MQTNSYLSRAWIRPLAWWAAGGVVLLWGFWTTLADISQRWLHDPQYSHGYLVPAFAIALLWIRRGQRPISSFQPSWWGVPLLVFAAAICLFAAYYAYRNNWLDQFSLLPFLVGICVLLGGWPALRWAWPAIAFLLFMIPLPYRLEAMLPRPLQHFATVGSTLALQTFGLPAFAEGNIIVMDEVRIGVVEACSGLSMLMIFMALSTAVAVVVDRPLWERGVILVSALPIALLANVTRITATGILHVTAGEEIANMVFHDLAGWLMMPLALGILWLELQLLSRLLLETSRAKPVLVALAGNRSRPRLRATEASRK